MTIPVHLLPVQLPNDVTLRAGVNQPYTAEIVHLDFNGASHSYKIDPPVAMAPGRPYVLTVPSVEGETAHVLALDN